PDAPRTKSALTSTRAGAENGSDEGSRANHPVVSHAVVDRGPVLRELLVRGGVPVYGVARAGSGQRLLPGDTRVPRRLRRGRRGRRWRVDPGRGGGYTEVHA